jgi:hypothetical protein
MGNGRKAMDENKGLNNERLSVDGVRTQVLYKVVLSGARRVKAVMDNREIE